MWDLLPPKFGKRRGQIIRRKFLQLSPACLHVVTVSSGAILRLNKFIMFLSSTRDFPWGTRGLMRPKTSPMGRTSSRIIWVQISETSAVMNSASSRMSLGTAISAESLAHAGYSATGLCVSEKCYWVQVSRPGHFRWTLRALKNSTGLPHISQPPSNNFCWGICPSAPWVRGHAAKDLNSDFTTLRLLYHLYKPSSTINWWRTLVSKKC